LVPHSASRNRAILPLTLERPPVVTKRSEQIDRAHRVAFLFNGGPTAPIHGG
jgi:hypothetical protein